MLVFRQLFDPQSSTYTYLLGDRPSGQAVLIDPVFEQVRRDTALLGELGHQRRIAPHLLEHRIDQYRLAGFAVAQQVGVGR